MQFKPPKNDDKYRWTNHVKGKMVYYGISESLIKRIVRFPKRKEIGVAEKTVAVMQPTSNKKKPQEIWVMYQELAKSRGTIDNGKKDLGHSLFAIVAKPIRVISAWRYPGISPAGNKIPIPEEILSAVAEAMADEARDF